MAPSTFLLGLLIVLAATVFHTNCQQLLISPAQNKQSQQQLSGQPLLLPAGGVGGNVLSVQSVATPVVQRRLSLEDFFLNRNNNQQQQQQPVQPVVIQTAPAAGQGQGFQITRPQPNQLLLMRDTRFPSGQGGLLSRLLMARRMLRLQRIASRLSLIPQVLGMGQQLRQNELAGNQPQSLILLNNRVGQQYEEPYDPREYVYGTKAFTYGNGNQQQVDNARNQQAQRDYNSGGANGNSQYQNEDGYVQPQDRYRNQDSYETKDNRNQDRQQQKQYGVVDSNTDALRGAQDYGDYEREPHQVNPQKPLNNLYQPNIDQQKERVQEYLTHLIQAQQELQNYQSQQEDNQQQQQPLTVQQQQQLIQQLQRNHPQQQKQQQILNLQGQQRYQQDDGSRPDSGGLYAPLGGIVVGALVPDQHNVVHSNIGGLGDNTAKSSTAVVPFEKKIEPLVPLGIFPKPLLNLKGRLFFGAEMGKGVKVNTGAGR